MTQLYVANSLLLIKTRTTYRLIEEYKKLYEQALKHEENNIKSNEDFELSFLDDLQDIIDKQIEEFELDVDITPLLIEGAANDVPLIINIENLILLTPFDEAQISLNQIQEFLEDEEVQKILTIISDAFLSFFETLTGISKYEFAIFDISKSATVYIDSEEEGENYE